MPEISVLTSVYNCENYLDEFLESILNQTFRDFELIIVNDGSTDKSKEVIENYRDPRIKLYNLEQNRGIAKALNFGLSKCNGKYIAKADADDVYTEDRLVKQKFLLDQNKNIHIVGTLLEYFAQDIEIKNGARYKSYKKYYEMQANNILMSKDIQETMYKYMCLAHSTMMIRGDLLREYRYDEEFNNLGEDYKLLYELNKKGYKMAKVDEKKSFIRVSGKSATAISNVGEHVTVRYKIKKYELEKLINNEILIWGYGSYGKEVYKKLYEEKFNVVGFIDSDISKIGESEFGINVYGKDILLNQNKKHKIIVASEPGRLEISNFLNHINYEHLKEYLVY